jgi:hypothetical protein
MHERRTVVGRDGAEGSEQGRERDDNEITGEKSVPSLPARTGGRGSEAIQLPRLSSLIS